MTAIDSLSDPPVTRRSSRKNALVACVVALIVGVDQLTKHWAVTHLDDGHVDHVIWTLQFNLSFNSGMAFGRGRGWGPVIGVVAMLVVIGLVLSIRRRNELSVNLAVGAVVGGALGNIVDRLFRGDGWLHGEVVDFIDFQWFPIFNVADISVNVGGALLLWAYLRTTPSAPPEST